MEITDFAEQVLFGRTLEDKLVDPGPLADQRPRGREVPSAPGRPADLAFAPGARAPFPSAAALEADDQRGRALHFFANHELLAAELMAAMLLRFPNAEKRFRLGLASTIVDEQRHLRRYVERMEALGIGLGDVPVNDYFWRATIDVPSPLVFVARMSLGFEQANLDFSKMYQLRFEEVGDEVTAALMQDVYEDEIRHVRFGVRWFDEKREPGPASWDAHVALLGQFNPLRLKSPVYFDVDGRRRAGLDDDYVERLRLLSGSRGRKPRVFFFNATAEEEVQHGVRYTAPTRARAVESDLSFVMAFLAKPEDVVVAPVPPPAVRTALLDAGFELPEVVASPLALGDRELAEIVPWGESPRIERLRSELGVEAVEVDSSELLSRALTVDLGAAFDPDARLARRLEDIPVGSLVKAAYAASGRHRRRIRTEEDLGDENLRRWIEKAIARDGFVVVEPWRERIRDFSLVLDVGGKKPLLGIYEQFVDETGRYRGHRLGDPLAGLDAAYRRGFVDHCVTVAEHVAKGLRARGYRGPAGVDMFLHEGGLRSVVDVNARYTMGHVARALFERVAPKTPARWVHGDPGSVQPSAVTMVDGKIASGTLLTSHAAAGIVETALVVGTHERPSPP